MAHLVWGADEETCVGSTAIQEIDVDGEIGHG